MNRTLDTEIRRAMGELADAAPLPRSVETLASSLTTAPSGRPSWRRGVSVLAATACVVAAIGVALVVLSGHYDRSTVIPVVVPSTVPSQTSEATDQWAHFSYPLVAANAVPTATPSPSQGQLVIDEGSDRGITVGMPVVNATGLVGNIVSVDKAQSVVRLATDFNFEVLAVRNTVDRQGATPGLVSGTGPDVPLHMRLLDPPTNAPTALSVGDLIVSAGGPSSLTPAGIPIGRVASIRPATSSRTTEIDLDWAAAQSSLTTVQVVLYRYQPPTL